MSEKKKEIPSSPYLKIEKQGDEIVVVGLTEEGKKQSHIVIPDGVTVIGKCAFAGTHFTSITISDTVVKIGDCAFADSKIHSLIIPDNVNEIGTMVCSGCKYLNTVRISKKMKTIPPYTFSDCHSLRSLFIPDNIIELGEGVCFNCQYLSSVRLSENLASIPSHAFEECSSLSTLPIPQKVTSIGDEAFAGSGLCSLYIPNNVTEIGIGLCYGCEHLTSVRLSENLTEIPALTFRYCSSLCDIPIPKKIASIGNFAFAGSSLRSLYIPDNVTEIGFGVCRGCEDLSSVRLSENLTAIPAFAFFDTSFNKIALPNKIETIEPYSLCRTRLNVLTIPFSVKEIKKKSLLGCYCLEKLIIMNQTTKVARDAFLDEQEKSFLSFSKLKLIVDGKLKKIEDLPLKTDSKDEVEDLMLGIEEFCLENKLETYFSNDTKSSSTSLTDSEPSNTDDNDYKPEM